QAVESVAHLGGPTVAGFAIQALSAPVSILIDAASFLGSALFVGAIRKHEAKPEPSSDANLRREIAEGLRLGTSSRILRSIAMCTGWSNLCGSIGNTLFIVLLARDLHLGAGVIGVVFSLASVGGLVAAVVAQRFTAWLGQGRVIWLAMAVAGL